MKILNKVCIVTGSSMGIGEAIATLYAENGAHVVVNSRKLERAQEVANRLVERGLSAIAVEADTSVKADVERLVETAVDKWGKLDVMVNNAGISMVRPSVELSEEDWRRAIDVNLTGVFFCSQAAAKHMIPQKSGSIIQIGSILGRVGLPLRAAYCSSKHGLIGLNKALATEWAEHKIRANVIDPGYIATVMDVHDQQSGGYGDEDILRRTPLGRYGTPEEIANLALFLASDDSSYITGTQIDVDGGWVAYGGW
ncbi:SDR family NAD(P)-dependent oxidoreductase [Aneurinibacillus tyrosinisolvens]|uniref:SDR family NAD(P)-dependent oxidoreductase n=1 Tax=Aneurinibacillus tyrosinisolvens TaxID=1443435 RepID=UPI000A5B2E8F|nr:SDR family NAD(P)-dependent oxidoreductase [Aneurinibacillus tyrosinisolvens]